MRWNEWMAALRASRAAQRVAALHTRSSAVMARPGLLTLVLAMLLVLVALVWPTSEHGEAAVLAESTPGPAVTVTFTPVPTASPTATVTASATLTPTTAQPTAHAELPVDAPLPPRGLAPRVNPQVTLLPTATATGADLPALLLPTATPTLTVIQALDQPLPTPRPGLGARLVAPTPAPADTPVSDPPPPQAEATIPPAPALQPTPALEPTPSGDVRSIRVPILMYHYLSVPPPGADIFRRDLSVSPDLFAEHLDAIARAGYTPISLYQWLAHLTQGAPLPEKPVVLTFDDGYRDNYTNAFPLLRERGMTATFFLVTDFIDDQRPEYVTWDMVREMYAGGMSIESHGRNHVSLAGKNSDYLIWQALGSLETIEYEVGVRPRFISYPAGEYDQLTVDIFRSAHYWAGFTTRQGATHSSDDLFQVRRVRVRGTTSAAELIRLLALDW